jgi:hypothetical protein
VMLSGRAPKFSATRARISVEQDHPQYTTATANKYHNIAPNVVSLAINQSTSLPRVLSVGPK